MRLVRVSLPAPFMAGDCITGARADEAERARAIERVAGPADDAGQDHRLALGERSAPEKLAQIERDAAKRRVAREPDLGEERLEAFEQAFDLRDARALDRVDLDRAGRAARDVELVGDHEHRLREVERRLRRSGGDAHEHAGARELGRRHAGDLGAEDQGDAGAGGFALEPSGQLARREHGLRPGPVAQRGGADDDLAIGERGGEIGVAAGAVEDLVGVHGEGARHRAERGRGLDQPQVGEPHVRHRARDGADVALLARAHEDDRGRGVASAQRFGTFHHADSVSSGGPSPPPSCQSTEGAGSSPPSRNCPRRGPSANIA